MTKPVSRTALRRVRGLALQCEIGRQRLIKNMEAGRLTEADIHRAMCIQRYSQQAFLIAVNAAAEVAHG